MPPTEFIPVNEVILVHGEPIPPSTAYEKDVVESWRRSIEQNPSLFNGPIVSPLEVSVDSAVCTLRWYHSDFAHYLYSRQNGDIPAAASVGNVFVSVALPTTTDGKLVVGRMSDHTSAPGVVQLPGGSVSIGPEQVEVSHRDLIATAIQEASEELGIVLHPASLRVCGIVKRHCPRDVGVVFVTEARSWNEILASFAGLQERERQAGVASEFAELLAVGPSPDLAHKSVRRLHTIDYLSAVINALLTTGGGVP